MMNERLEAKLRLLPDRSGVYLFRDKGDEILYVGKAKRLHLRVRSYFRRKPGTDARLDLLVERIVDLDTIVTANENEALILEANLIKRHRPAFNIELKDDKRYPYLKVSLYHRFPGLFLTRKIAADGSRYFGPYTHVKDLRQTLKTLRKVFPLRNCTDRRVDREERECLEFFIERCPAPCTKRIESDAYAATVGRLVRFLEGDVASVVEELRSQMLAAAVELRFEESARLRDDIETLERIAQQQRMTPSLAADTDVIGVVARGGTACCATLHVRDGKVLGKDTRMMSRAEGTPIAEILRTVIARVYLESPQVPPEIVTGETPREVDLLQDGLTERAGKPVRIRVARGGVLGRLHDAARDNAHMRLEEEELRERNRRGHVDAGIYDLQERLELAATPYRIEGYDISNLQETHAVASRVCFQDGSPLKSGYRRYRIRQVQGPDDFAMIGEVLRRRLRRLREEGETPPDLILIDGGKGQVGRARDVLEEEGWTEIPILGLAKREELVVLPGVKAPVRLPRSSAGLRLLQRVRDEAHRFAVTYHRTLRSKGQTRSALDPLPGIGPRRRAQLLRHFGSLEAMRRASVETIARVPGIGPIRARALRDALDRGWTGAGPAGEAQA
jgi:excinuclease ABC subunit C